MYFVCGEAYVWPGAYGTGGQLVGAGSFLPTLMFQGSNSGPQAGIKCFFSLTRSKSDF